MQVKTEQGWEACSWVNTWGWGRHLAAMPVPASQAQGRRFLHFSIVKQRFAAARLLRWRTHIILFILGTHRSLKKLIGVAQKFVQFLSWVLSPITCLKLLLLPSQTSFKLDSLHSSHCVLDWPLETPHTVRSVWTHQDPLATHGALLSQAASLAEGMA